MCLQAAVAESADAQDLGSCEATRAGSTPARGTKCINERGQPYIGLHAI